MKSTTSDILNVTHVCICGRECWRSVACVFSAVLHTPVRRAASCVQGEGGCQCLCPAEAAVYLFAPGSRRAFAHSSNNKHWWLLTKALVPASPNSGDLEVPGGLPMYPCPWHRDRKCKYSQFGPCIHAHCNIKLYVDGVWLCWVIRGTVMPRLHKDE